MFYLKEPKSTNETPIYLIYRIEGRNLKLSTGEKIHPDKWDVNKKWPINKRNNFKLKGVEAVLRRYQSKVDDYFGTCKIKGVEPSFIGLKLQFESNKVISFNDYIGQFIENSNNLKKRNGKPISKRTLQAYSTTKDYLNEFGTKQFNELDVKFHRDFTNFLSDRKNLATNTIGGYVKNLKVFAKHAHKEGYPVNPQILSSDFFVAEEKSESIYLNEDEINSLFNLNGLTERQRKVRDWAIIGLWTGLRVSDWDKFNPKGDLVEIETEKTGRRVVIPLHRQVKKIIKNGLPEPCSNGEFNRMIKIVCKEAGITQKVYGSRRNPETNRLEKGMIEKNLLVSSHTCRRSFATNNYLMGIDTLTIMQITGHTTEKNFLKYIKVTPDEHAKRLLEKWNEYYSDDQ